MSIPFFRLVEFSTAYKKFVRSNAKIAEIIVALLHSSKHNVERGLENKNLGFLQDHTLN